MRNIVIMPGGFHPFHAGHAALYQSALKAFDNADTYVAATNDTKTRPFPFAIKEKLARLAGVADQHFVQVKSPFKAEEITSNYNPNEDVLIFVRSEKDKTEQPKPGGTKKDGSPAYFQPWTGKNLQPFSKHAYIAYLPTVEFGPGIKSATEIRNAWPNLDDRRKTAMVMSLYPVTQKNPKLAANVVKMLDIGMGGQEQVSEGVAETLPMDDAVKVLRHYGADHFKTTSNELHFYKNGRPLSVDLIWGNEGERSVNLSQLNSATRQLKGQGVAEGLDEAVGDNYLYHATQPSGMMRILRSGAIKASYRPQEATKARTQSPTVSTTRSKQYAESDDFVNFLNLTKEGNSVIIVFDRSAVANHYKMFGTSQGTQTVGDEFEEVIVVPKGAMPIQGTMKGFYFNPKRTAEIEEFKDTPWFKELLNSPYYMGQKQSVAEGSQSKDDLIWTLNNFDYYTDNGSVYVNDNGDKIARIGSNWKHQSGKMGSGAEELSAFLSSLQGVAEGAPIVVAQAPIHIRNPKKTPQPYRNQGDIVPPTKPPSTEKRGVKGRPGQRPMPTYESAGLSIEQLAHISDKALDDAYHYGRSTPGANFGWMANLQSAKAAKKLIDAGETDIEAISDAIHKGWNITAAADYKGQLQLDTPTPEEKKLKRAKLAMQSYSQLPEEEKEKDRVVARAMLAALGKTNVSESADYLDEK
jgi:hypothetical protein